MRCSFVALALAANRLEVCCGCPLHPGHSEQGASWHYWRLGSSRTPRACSSQQQQQLQAQQPQGQLPQYASSELRRLGHNGHVTQLSGKCASEVLVLVCTDERRAFATRSTTPPECGSECWGVPLPVRMPKPRCNPVLPVTGEPAAAAAATMTANQRPVCCKRRRTPASNLPSVVAAQLCDDSHHFDQVLASALFLH